MPTCPHCSVPDQTGDFCTCCGKALPKPEAAGPRIVLGHELAKSGAGRTLQVAQLTKQMRTAFVVLLVLSILQFLAGGAFYWLSTTDMDPDAVKVLQVVAITQLIFGALFLALAVWARKAPLPAAVTGLTIFLTFWIIGVVAEPTNALRGILINVIIVLALVRAVQAGLKYREIMRQNPTGT